VDCQLTAIKTFERRNRKRFDIDADQGANG
jgi:hypothetical protein